MPFEMLPDEEPQPQGKTNRLFSGSAVARGQDVVRNVVRTAHNLGSTAIGLPGSALAGINELAVNPLAKAVTGQEGQGYEQLAISKILPTIEQVKGRGQTLSGEYLKPQNKIEKVADDIVEDAFLLAVPYGRVAKGAMAAKPAWTLAKKLATSIGANLAGETVEQVTGSEKAGAYTKMGSMFLGGLLDKPSMIKQVGSVYNEARAAIPPGASINASQYESQLNRLENSILKNRPVGNLSQPEKFVYNEIQKARALIDPSGDVGVEQLWAQKTSLHKELGDRKLYEMGRAGVRDVKNQAKLLNRVYADSLAEYGKTNPAFYHPFKAADRAFGALQQSEFISRGAEKLFGEHGQLFSHLDAGLFGVGGAAYSGAHMAMGATSAGLGAIAAKGAVGLAAYETGKSLYQIVKSPLLRDLYGKMITAIAKEDSAAFIKYGSKLDSKLSEESKPRYQLLPD